MLFGEKYFYFCRYCTRKTKHPFEMLCMAKKTRKKQKKTKNWHEPLNRQKNVHNFLLQLIKMT